MAGWMRVQRRVTPAPSQTRHSSLAVPKVLNSSCCCTRSSIPEASVAWRLLDEPWRKGLRIFAVYGSLGAPPTLAVDFGGVARSTGELEQASPFSWRASLTCRAHACRAAAIDSGRCQGVKFWCSSNPEPPHVQDREELSTESDRSQVSYPEWTPEYRLLSRVVLPMLI